MEAGQRTLTAQGPQGPVQALGHEYLGNGLLRQRSDGLAGVTEDFSYDALERLTRWQVLAPGQNSEVTYTHDDVGNLLARTERLGTTSAQRYEYRYGGNGGGPHAVTGYAGDTFRYDAVGRQTDWQAADGRWRRVEYTTVGLPRRVQAQGLEVRYNHDAHQRRVHRRTAKGDETVYMGGLYEKRQQEGTLTHVFHVHARGRPVAQVAWVEKPQGVASSTVWLHADGLGSVVALTDTSGAVVERRKYQPYGQRARPDNPAFTLEPLASTVRHGFTGHEEDSEAGLLLTPGRAYDTRVGRFLTADPYTQPSSQGLNRYAYALNSPLNLVDPSGFTATEICSTAEGAPCASSPSSTWAGDTGEGTALGAVRQALAGLGQWHEEETRKAAQGASANPIPSPAPLADQNGSRLAAQEVTAGATLALAEMGAGTLRDMLGQIFNPTQAALEQAAEMGSALVGGYLENGVLGAANTLNPVYHLLVSGHQASAAVDSGDGVGAGYHGVLAAATAASLVGMVAGGARALRPSVAGLLPRSNMRLIQEIARRAEARIGGKGHAAGSRKHAYAKRLLLRYQTMIKDRGLLPESSWLHGQDVGYGRPGSIRIDVLDKNMRIAYEYKFGTRLPAIRLYQIQSIFLHGPSDLLMVIEINP